MGRFREMLLDERVYPLSDMDMVYDYENHFYVLTPQYINKALGTNLSEVLEMTDVTNEAEMPKLWLKRVSRLVYEKLYQHTFDRDYKEFCFAKDGRWRPRIKFWLEEQALYMLNNGDIGLQAGISYEKSTSNDLYQIRGDRMYSPIMIQNMLSTGALYGGTLCYHGDFSYEKDGY